jgi:hypothetical protein
MKQVIKKVKGNTVPLLCWDIYAEHLDTLLGKNKFMSSDIQKRKK